MTIDYTKLLPPPEDDVPEDRKRWRTSNDYSGFMFVACTGVWWTSLRLFTKTTQHNEQPILADAAAHAMAGWNDARIKFIEDSQQEDLSRALCSPNEEDAKLTISNERIIRAQVAEEQYEFWHQVWLVATGRKKETES